MSGRIDWARYEGDDIEAVVAMMLNREHPDSIRICPSQGDGGVDVLDRGVGPEGGDVVYQVKRFTKPLSSSDKAKIKNSLETLLHPTKRDERWSDLNVTQWRLVMPLDPTSGDDEWFHKTLLTDYDVDAVWDGLVLVEQLTAKYDDVIDYYLGDGRTAVADAYARAMALISLGQAPEGGLTVSDVALRVQQAVGLLDHDPHYRYEVRLGHGTPNLVERPNLVMTWIAGEPKQDTWAAVDVIARCATSTEERPITISTSLVITPGDDFAKALKDFHNYGTPFASPTGAFSGTIDAPGGLGGPITGAAVEILPTEYDGDVSELYLEVIDPEAKTLAGVDLDVVEHSVGVRGIRTVYREIHGLFNLIRRLNLPGYTGVTSLTMNDPEGEPVATTRNAYEFLAAFHHPNSTRASIRHTPAANGQVEAIPADVPETVIDQLETNAKMMRLLYRLQEHAADVLRVPDEATFKRQNLSWQLADTVLAGDIAHATVGKKHVFHVDLAPGFDLPDDKLTFTMELDVWVGKTPLYLGKIVATVLDPVLLGEPVEWEGKTLQQVGSGSGRARYEQLPPSQPDAAVSETPTSLQP